MNNDDVVFDIISDSWGYPIERVITSDLSGNDIFPDLHMNYEEDSIDLYFKLPVLVVDDDFEYCIDSNLATCSLKDLLIRLIENKNHMHNDEKSLPNIKAMLLDIVSVIDNKFHIKESK